jgi:hypothetical protein
MKTSQLPKSNDRMYLHTFYANQYNQTKRESSAQLAMWYHFLHLAFDHQPKPIEMTKPVLNPEFNNLTINQQVLYSLEQVRDHAYYRRGNSGICRAVDKVVIENYNILDRLLYTRASIKTSLKNAFISWEFFSYSTMYPIPGGEYAYDQAWEQRKSWTRSTKYGALRWDLLEHCIKHYTAAVAAEQAVKKAKASRKKAVTA